MTMSDSSKFRNILAEYNRMLNARRHRISPPASEILRFRVRTWRFYKMLHAVGMLEFLKKLPPSRALDWWLVTMRFDVDRCAFVVTAEAYLSAGTPTGTMAEALDKSR